MFNLQNLYLEAYFNNLEAVENFIDSNEKANKKNFMKFCKDCHISADTVAKVIHIQQEEFTPDNIKNIFDNSNKFKIIQYDEDNFFIDIINKKDLSNDHMFKFSKDDSGAYIYI